MATKPVQIAFVGYIITDWIFFFSEKNKKDVNKIFSGKDNKDLKDEFITWKLITVFLPLVTFLTVVFLNLLFAICPKMEFYKFFNNGSLPIISFGILTSGMPFLLERLETFPEFHTVRRRVMAIALIFLFLSAVLYIVETFSPIATLFDEKAKLIAFFFSIYIFLFSCSVGYKMFLLQSKNIKGFEDVIDDEVSGISASLKDLENE